MPAYFGPVETDHRGEFRRKLLGGNNEIVTGSEGYVDSATAERWPADLLRWVVEAHADFVRAEVMSAIKLVCDPGQAERIADDVIDRLTLPG